ncbi:MAG: hypothetical protein WEE20_04860 [Bacteroidota bacterium]
MKRVLAVAVILLAVSVASAQVVPGLLTPPQEQVVEKMVKKSSAFRSASQSNWSSALAYASFGLSGGERFGPTLFIQYSPNNRMNPMIDLYAGLMIGGGKSGTVNENDYIPVASRWAPYYSPYSNVTNPYYYDYPRLSFGVAMLGADLTYYFARGDVRPYVGAGAMVLGWGNQGTYSATVAPAAKGGVQINMSRGLDGFVEVRHAVGVPSLIGPATEKFNGFTAASFGISFFPKF